MWPLRHFLQFDIYMTLIFIDLDFEIANQASEYNMCQAKKIYQQENPPAGNRKEAYHPRRNLSKHNLSGGGGGRTSSCPVPDGGGRYPILSHSGQSKNITFRYPSGGSGKYGMLTRPDPG